MKYDITAKQLVYFRTHGELSFEEFLDDTTHSSLSSFKEGVSPSVESAACKKFALSRSVGELIHLITEKKPIRFLFDRVVHEDSFSIEEINIQGILLIIRIPLNTNEVTFLKPEPVIEIESPSWLLVYTIADAVYIYSENDTVSWLKEMGYSYGDRLKSEDFPLIYS